MLKQIRCYTKTNIWQYLDTLSKDVPLDKPAALYSNNENTMKQGQEIEFSRAITKLQVDNDRYKN